MLILLDPDWKATTGSSRASAENVVIGSRLSGALRPDRSNVLLQALLYGRVDIAWVLLGMRRRRHERVSVAGCFGVAVNECWVS